MLPTVLELAEGNIVPFPIKFVLVMNGQGRQSVLLLLPVASNGGSGCHVSFFPLKPAPQCCGISIGLLPCLLLSNMATIAGGSQSFCILQSPGFAARYLVCVLIYEALIRVDFSGLSVVVSYDSL